MGLFRILSVLAAATLGAGVAYADVAPPPDYVEQCTVARQQQPGQECQGCNAWHGDTEICARTLSGALGWSKRCRTRGASAWTEIWCRSASPPPPPPTGDRPEPPDGPLIGPAPPNNPAPNDNRFAEPPPPQRPVRVDPGPQPGEPGARLPPSSPGSRGCGGGSCALGRIESADVGWAGACAALALLALAGRRRRRTR